MGKPLTLAACIALVVALGTTSVALGLARANQRASRPRGNVTIHAFEHAKVHLRVLYAEHPETLYSGCAFDDHLAIGCSRCSYRPRRYGPRSQRVEWEHVVPAEAFGRQFVAWRLGDPACINSQGTPFKGRKCAQRVSPAYRHIEADLYNLVPEIGEVNQMRSNHPMDAIGDPKAVLMASGSKSSRTAFEPRKEVKGDVARTYLYMHETYPGLQLLSKKRRLMFARWSALDPVDAWECRRTSRIEAIQGNANLPVRRACMAAALWPVASAAGIRPPQ